MCSVCRPVVHVPSNSPDSPERQGFLPCFTEATTQDSLGEGQTAGKRRNQVGGTPKQCPMFTWAFKKPQGRREGHGQVRLSGQPYQTYNLTVIKKSSANPCLFSNDSVFIGSTEKELLGLPPYPPPPPSLSRSPGVGH